MAGGCVGGNDSNGSNGGDDSNGDDGGGPTGTAKATVDEPYSNDSESGTLCETS
jgi:hypothetical protein